MTLRQLCVAEDYDGLIFGLRLRIREVGSSCESIDHLTGLASGHTTKIIAPRKIRIAGKISLGLLLQALNLRLVVCVDDTAAGQYRDRLPRAKIRHWDRELDWDAVSAVAAKRDLRVHTVDLGPDAVLQVAERTPALGSVLRLKPAPAKAAPEPAKRAVYNPDERHPLPERRRFVNFARGHRKHRPSAGAAA